MKLRLANENDKPSDITHSVELRKEHDNYYRSTNLGYKFAVETKYAISAVKQCCDRDMKALILEANR